MKPVNFAEDRTSRREFLLGASAAAIAAASPRHAFTQQPVSSPVTSLPQSEAGLGKNPTRDASLKFYPDGTVKPFAGNTVICHIPQQCRFRDGTVALHDALVKSSFANKLGILPPESYHMTIYPGANDQDRTRSSWPGGVARDASIEQCSRMMKARMEAARFTGPFPLRVRVDVPSTLDYGRASTLRMAGADAASEKALRSLRDHIAEVYQYRSPDHDAYGFHITLAYTMADLSTSEMAEYRRFLRQAVERIASATPVLELGLPEYCTFKNMYRFDTEVMLRST
jgi:hypothetical protein